MSQLDEIVTLIHKQGYHIKVYANNDAVFGFGIYHPLDGTHRVQIGYTVFSMNYLGMCEFLNGGVGVRTFQVGEYTSEEAKNLFAKAITQTLELK